MTGLEKNSPLVMAISRFDWQLFVTLTFKNPMPSMSGCSKLLFAFLRQASRQNQVHFKTSFWCVRGELGEATRRFHLHVLLGRLGPFAQTRATIFGLIDFWQNLRLDVGSHAGEMGDMARIWPYESSLDGVGYVLKGLERYAFLSEAQSYECVKFGLTDRVTLSESLAAHLQDMKRHWPETVQTPQQGEIVGDSIPRRISGREQIHSGDNTDAKNESKPFPCGRDVVDTDVSSSQAGSIRLCKHEIEWLCRPVFPASA